MTTGLQGQGSTLNFLTVESSQALIERVLRMA